MSDSASRIVVLALWPWQQPRPMPRVQWAALHELIKDFQDAGIEPTLWPPLARWDSSQQKVGHDGLEEWETWIYIWERDWPRLYLHYWPEFETRLLSLLAEGFQVGSLRGLLLVRWALEGNVFFDGELERFLTAAPPLPVVLVDLTSRGPQFRMLSIGGIREPRDRRVDRELVHELFLSPVDSGAGAEFRVSGSYLDKPTEVPAEGPTSAPAEAAYEAPATPAPAVGRPPPVASARPRRPRSLRSSRSVRGPDEVHLGISAPAAVAAGEAFVARFAAYTEACRSEVHRVLDQEAPSAQPRLDLERCRWHPGTKVTVRLAADRVEVPNPVQSFTWNGTWQVLRFDATVHATAVGRAIVLRFDIAVEGLPLLALRPELGLLEDPLAEKAKTVSLVEARAPRSAFASYARGDRREVLGRVRSLQIFTGIDVFLDCLSIRPGEEWKPRLSNEIRARDVFWLFWSRTARASEWVDWEWRTALRTKSLGGIQPHPLEPIELAPPPEELSALEFGTMYEWYLVALRQSWFSRRLRRLWHVWLSFWGTLSRMARRRAWAPNP